MMEEHSAEGMDYTVLGSLKHKALSSEFEVHCSSCCIAVHSSEVHHIFLEPDWQLADRIVAADCSLDRELPAAEHRRDLAEE